MNSPYHGLDARAYWKTGVGDRHILSIGDIYRKKFAIRTEERIATAGSCFAQHISRRLKTSGYTVLDAEIAPRELPFEKAQAFGYALYSARYGNIYTVRQMLQLAQECLGQRSPADIVWQRGDRYHDAMRPSVEPKGLPSADAVLAHRRQHLARVKWLLDHTTLLVFTMGLTETWENTGDGTVYPTAPGTIAGSYDPEQYKFRNLSYEEVLGDFLQLRTILHGINPGVRFILTVSPVPLTATATDSHVLPATTYSKSVLRAVAGYLEQTCPDVDYFPSYEIIASAPARGMFYESNLRSVASPGVDVVMRSFFAEHQAVPVDRPHRVATETSEARFQAEQKVFCDEELLDAFA